MGAHSFDGSSWAGGVGLPNFYSTIISENATHDLDGNLIDDLIDLSTPVRTARCFRSWRKGLLSPVILAGYDGSEADCMATHRPFATNGRALSGARISAKSSRRVRVEYFVQPLPQSGPWAFKIASPPASSSFAGDADEGRIAGCTAHLDQDRVLAARQVRHHDVCLRQTDRPGRQARELHVCQLPSYRDGDEQCRLAERSIQGSGCSGCHQMIQRSNPGEVHRDNAASRRGIVGIVDGRVRIRSRRPVRANQKNARRRGRYRN